MKLSLEGLDVYLEDEEDRLRQEYIELTNFIREENDANIKSILYIILSLEKKLDKKYIYLIVDLCKITVANGLSNCINMSTIIDVKVKLRACYEEKQNERINNSPQGIATILGLMIIIIGLTNPFAISFSVLSMTIYVAYIIGGALSLCGPSSVAWKSIQSTSYLGLIEDASKKILGVPLSIDNGIMHEKEDASLWNKFSH